MRRTLLAANWENLLVASFETEKEFLKKWLPANTELHDWQGKYIMSLVGFRFSKTSLFGIPSPFYRNFDEVNLRFYARHKDKTGWKNGVVFIKEIAPYRLVGLFAKWLYRENFARLPMKHSFSASNITKKIEYYWKVNKEWNYLKLQTGLHPIEMPVNSIESFIAGRRMGYTKLNNDKTREFEIAHRPWQIYPGESFDMQLDAKTIYGEEFNKYFLQKPLAVFLMDGSRTKVSSPVLL